MPEFSTDPYSLLPTQAQRAEARGAPTCYHEFMHPHRIERHSDDASSPWRRTLLVAFLAQTIALMGFTLIFPFLPLYIQTLGVHGRSLPVWAGVISFSGSLPLVVMGPVWGSLGDRYGRKAMIIRAMTSGSVTMGLLAVAPNVWTLVALLTASGLLTGVNAPLQAQSPR